MNTFNRTRQVSALPGAALRLEGLQRFQWTHSWTVRITATELETQFRMPVSTFKTWPKDYISLKFRFLRIRTYNYYLANKIVRLNMISVISSIFLIGEGEKNVCKRILVKLITIIWPISHLSSTLRVSKFKSNPRNAKHVVILYQMLLLSWFS